MKFSIQQLLVLISLIAVYSLALASASRGGAVGYGVAVAAPALVIWFLVLAVVYHFALAIGKLLPGSKRLREQGATKAASTKRLSADSGETEAGS